MADFKSVKLGLSDIGLSLDGNYEVAGGLGSTIVADEWEKYEKN